MLSAAAAPRRHASAGGLLAARARRSTLGLVELDRRQNRAQRPDQRNNPRVRRAPDGGGMCYSYRGGPIRPLVPYLACRLCTVDGSGLSRSRASNDLHHLCRRRRHDPALSALATHALLFGLAHALRQLALLGRWGPLCLWLGRRRRGAPMGQRRVDLPFAQLLFRAFHDPALVRLDARRALRKRRTRHVLHPACDREIRVLTSVLQLPRYLQASRKRSDGWSLGLCVVHGCGRALRVGLSHARALARRMVHAGQLSALCARRPDLIPLLVP